MRDTFPFIAAIAMLICGPIFAARARRQVAGWIQQSQPYSSVRAEDIPDYLAPAQINVYVEYASDVVQIVPAITLTVVGAVLAVPDAVPAAWTGAIVLGVVVVVFAVDALVMSMSPQRFIRRKILWLSPVALICVALNLLGVLLVTVVA